mgnify:FL=1
MWGESWVGHEEQALFCWPFRFKVFELFGVPAFWSYVFVAQGGTFEDFAEIGSGNRILKSGAGTGGSKATSFIKGDKV